MVSLVFLSLSASAPFFLSHIIGLSLAVENTPHQIVKKIFCEHKGDFY